MKHSIISICFLAATLLGCSQIKAQKTDLAHQEFPKGSYIHNLADTIKLDAALTLLHRTNRFNGTVLYAENGKVVYKKAFGVVDHRTNEKLSTASSFNLASVSKQFFCMGILLLEEQGFLRLDDDIKKYIPELPYDGITIRNLMNHVSGIPEYFDVFIRYKSPLDTLTNEGMIRLFAEHRPALDFPTGTKWAYCNTNYVLLASIMERTSKMTSQDFLSKYIFKPLQLNDTYVYHVLMPSIPHNHVIGFEETGTGRKLNDLTAFDGVVGDGNIYASVNDLLSWEQSLRTSKLVSEKSLAQMFLPVKLKDSNSHPYGFGWFIENEKHYWHTGSWAGFINLIYRDAKTNRTAIVLSSGSNGLANKVVKDFMQGKELKVPTTFLIHNVLLIDGTGTKTRQASVRIENDRIIAVGELTPLEGEILVDGQNKILAPGFIDSHSHLQGYLSIYPDALAALNQEIGRAHV